MTFPYFFLFLPQKSDMPKKQTMDYRKRPVPQKINKWSPSLFSSQVSFIHSRHIFSPRHFLLFHVAWMPAENIHTDSQVQERKKEESYEPSGKNTKCIRQHLFILSALPLVPLFTRASCCVCCCHPPDVKIEHLGRVSKYIYPL